jgi:hypothetical protein
MSTAAAALIRRTPGQSAWPVYLLAVLVGIIGSAGLAVAASSGSPVKAVVMVLGAAATVGMFLSPDIALWCLTLSLPLERIGRLTDDSDAVAISASRILGLIALASMILHKLLRREKLYFELPVWLFAGYTAVAGLSNLWAWEPDETYRDSVRVLGNLLFFFLIINLIRDYAKAKTAVILWLIASLGAASYSLVDYVRSRGAAVAETEMGLQANRSATTVSDLAEARSLGTSVRRLFGTTAHPTLFGVNMAMTIPFLFWAFRATHGPWRVLWLGGLAISTISVLLSNTRAVLLLAVGLVAIALLRQLWKPTIFVIAALAIAGAAAIPFIPDDVWKRTLDPSLYTASKGDAIRVRFKFWEKSYELITEVWPHGIGVGNQSSLQKRVTDEQTGYLSTQGLRASAHNEFIWVMVEVGLVGYLLFWGFVFYVTWAAFQAGSIFRRKEGRTERYWLTVACSALLTGIPLFALQSEAFHYPLKGWWLIAPIACMLLRVARELPEPPRPTLEARPL